MKEKNLATLPNLLEAIQDSLDGFITAVLVADVIEKIAKFRVSGMYLYIVCFVGFILFFYL